MVGKLLGWLVGIFPSFIQEQKKILTEAVEAKKLEKQLRAVQNNKISALLPHWNKWGVGMKHIILCLGREVSKEETLTNSEIDAVCFNLSKLLTTNEKHH